MLISLAVLGAGIGLLVHSASVLTQEPLTTWTTFCTDLKQKDYSKAYQLFSAQFLLQTSGADFKQASTLHEQFNGVVQSCGLKPGASVSVTNAPGGLQATFSARMTRVLTTTRAATSYTGAVRLVFEQNAWRIDAITPELMGSNIDPVIVTQTFCSGLVNENYGDAYTTLSAGQKSLSGQDTLDDFTKSFVTTNHAGGETLIFTDCTPLIGSYRAPSAGINPSVQLLLQATIQRSGQTTQVAQILYTFILVQENGHWKIDDYKSA
jgi:hypothetical protein